MTDTKNEMLPIHYGLSFIAGKWTENSVRLWIESRVRLIDEATGNVEDYYQCASCKSEDTFAEKDLFYQDNYDFTPIFGPEYGVIFRRKAYLNDNYRSVQKVDKMWDGPNYKIKQPQFCQLLLTNAEIRRATNEGLPLVAQTELYNPALQLRAIIEYPVKTMNIHDSKDLYQTDTGPLLFPDISVRYDRLVDSLSLAYAAFNVDHFTDFVIERPTTVYANTQQQSEVHHYSEIVSLQAVNRLYSVI
ncbi:hypothetical protein [Paenibacillus eucommiae]|uniref:Uncharacterized protein n=1 Tax=Paenibacillus eucommiae TaxID=1355755 RepID=A0ABS4INR0_9BACL|nr:hypothetical protein [Paenibacillus eucommiae]MBP1988571.1 hypothetical protein [Paenibacillus eucommiae]